MVEDILFNQMFPAPERWEAAIWKGRDKDIKKSELSEMCDPNWLANLAIQFITNKYIPAPPHMAEIPKDEPGKFRTVFANEPKDRVILSVINDLLIENFMDTIHSHCVSYLPGIGTGKIVRWISPVLLEVKSISGVIGWKSDLSKYFDSVPLWAIDQLLDKLGDSCVVNAIRRYYHQDWCFDLNGKLVEKYQSLKQGCAVASFLADALLYDMDEKLTKMAKAVGGIYYRYSDDCLYLGSNYEEAMEVMKAELARFELTLNPKKVEYLTRDEWFKFLGWNKRGEQRTLSKNRIKNFADELYKRTMGAKVSGKKALRIVNRYLYGGEHSFATAVLPVITVEKDRDALDNYAKDIIRCCEIGRYKRKDIGGLGVVLSGEEYTIVRGKGDAIKTARERTPKEIPGYLTLKSAQNALNWDRGVYETLVRGVL